MNNTQTKINGAENQHISRLTWVRKMRSVHNSPLEQPLEIPHREPYQVCLSDRNLIVGANTATHREWLLATREQKRTNQ